MIDLMMYMPGMMDDPVGGWSGLWWPFMLIRLLILGVFLSLLVWFAVRVFSREGEAARPGATTIDSAEEILRERFARGDISAEEYEKSMKALRDTPPRKGYEDYVREAEERLRSERDTES